MHAHHLLALALAGLILGCGGADEPASPSADATAGDTGSHDSDRDSRAETDAGVEDASVDATTETLVVSFLAPADKTYARGGLDLEATVIGGVADEVTFFRNGESIGSTTTAPFRLVWNTTGTPEGAATLTARARRGTAQFLSDPITVFVDRTRPTLLVATPADGSDAHVGAKIELTFSEPVLATTLSDTSIKLEAEGGISIAKSVTVSSDGRRVTVTPTVRPLAPSARTLTLTEDLTDFAGNPVESAPVVRRWEHPTHVRDSLGMKAALADVAVDAADRPWVAYNEGFANLTVSRWDGAAWVAVGANLSLSPTAEAFDADLVITPGGRTLVAFEQLVGTSAAPDIYVREWTGSSWSTIGGAISAQPGETAASYPSLAADSKGRIVVAFTEKSSVYPYAFGINVRRWDGVAWSAIGGELSAFPGDTFAYAPHLAVDGSDAPCVVWNEEAVETGPSLRQAIVRRWNGVEWVGLGTPSGAMGAATAHTSTYGIAVTSTGDVLVARGEGVTATDKVYVERFAGTGVGLPVGGAAIPCGVACPGSSYGAMAIDRNGHPLVTWISPTRAVQAWRYEDAIWKRFGDLTPTAGAAVLHSKIAVDSTNSPILAWPEAFSSSSHVVVWSPNR